MTNNEVFVHNSHHFGVLELESLDTSQLGKMNLSRPIRQASLTQTP